MSGSNGKPLRGPAKETRRDALQAREAEQAGAEQEPAGAGQRLPHGFIQLAELAQEDVPARPAQSSNFWGQFPDHDPDFLAGRRSLADVKAEYEGRQLERQARDDIYYNRTGDRAVNREPRPMPTLPPRAFPARDEHGVPLQVSVERGEGGE